MPWAEGQPDPNVLVQLYGAERSSDPLDIVLASMYARRRHLDLLIALVEVERTTHKQTHGK